MKKAWKTIGASVIAILFIFISTSIASKHGWRLWGFEKCQNPNEVYVTDVYVTDEFVYICGGIFSSALKFNGYTYKMVDESLYVGVRYGLFEGEGADFSFGVEGNFSHLKNVILTDESEERCIWSIENDKK